MWGSLLSRPPNMPNHPLHKTHYRNFQLHPFSLVVSVHDIVMQANNEDAEREIRAIMDLFDVDDYSDDSPVDKDQFWLGYRLQKLDFARPFRLIAKKRRGKGPNTSATRRYGRDGTPKCPKT